MPVSEDETLTAREREVLELLTQLPQLAAAARGLAPRR